jgi:cell division protein FtsI/penicillin-binding protein 2
MSSAFISSIRYWFVLLSVSFMFSGLMGRLVYLQAIKHDEYSKIANGNRKSSLTLSARRGNILDSRGNPLAVTQPRIELGADPQLIEEEDYPKFVELAKLIGADPVVLKEKATRKTRIITGANGRKIRPVRWVKLADSIDEEVYQNIKKLDIPGVYGNRNYTRMYPGGNLASHVLGFLQKDGSPVTGVERYMDYYLSGQDGWKETERDGLRRELLQFETQKVSPQDGLNVELTLDLFIQNLIEEQITIIAEEYTPNSVSIIVSEPNTGYILGMANYPDFDLNHSGKAKMETMRNRSITDIIEPGSTFKLIPISAALNEKIVTTENTFDCNIRTVSYRGRTLKLPSDHRNYGELTLGGILKKSSNRGAAFIGIRLGEKALYEYARAYGYGQKTGIGLTGEVNGIVHPVNKWDSLTITRFPIGYAIGATPIQIHNAMATVANYGIIMQPQVIHKITNDEGKSVVTFRPKAKRRVISVDTARKMGDMLSGVVTPQGTAIRASLDGFSISGKTGTTRKIINGAYTNDKHTASFSGFFPTHRPRVVISVFVDEPKLDGPGYGGRVAAPVFRNIASELVKHLGIRPGQNDGRLAAK